MSHFWCPITHTPQDVAVLCQKASTSPVPTWGPELLSTNFKDHTTIFGVVVDLPTSELHQLTVLDAVVLLNLAPSKGQARPVIKQGGLKVNGIKITDTAQLCTLNLLHNEALVFELGKFNFNLIFSS